MKQLCTFSLFALAIAVTGCATEQASDPAAEAEVELAIQVEQQMEEVQSMCAVENNYLTAPESSSFKCNFGMFCECAGRCGDENIWTYQMCIARCDAWAGGNC